MENKTDLSKKKVLIVDDDEFLINMYSVKFNKEGLQVDTASSGAEALLKLKSGISPDALLLDIIMPSMDGLELLEKIKSEKLAEKAVIIVLTNQGQSTDIERAKKLGVNSYIVKASTIPSEVLKEVVRLLGEKS